MAFTRERVQARLLIALLILLALAYPFAHAAPFRPECGAEAYENLIMQMIVAKGGGACWPLDDAVGATPIRELTGVYPGTPSGTGLTLQAVGPVVSGQLVPVGAFDGAAGYVNPATKPTLTQNFTLIAWVYPVSFAANMSPISQRSPTSANTGQFHWWIVVTTGQITIDVPTGTANGRWSTGVNLSLNAWQHIAVTYDGTSRYVYLNGVQTGPNTARSGALNTTASALYIGRNSSDMSGAFWNGSMAYPTIISAALTASEILGIYNGAVKGL